MILPSTITYVLLLNSITSIIASPEKNPQRDTRIKVLLDESPPIVKKRSLVKYDATIHGPNKAFRMKGPAVTSFKHDDGTFNLQAYKDSMADLVTSEQASNKKLAHMENQYRKRNLLQKRKVTPLSSEQLAKDTDVPYLTEVQTTIGLGTPVQQVEVTFTLASSDTIIFSSDFPGGFNASQSTTVAVSNLESNTVVDQAEKSPYVYNSGVFSSNWLVDYVLFNLAGPAFVLVLFACIPTLPFIIDMRPYFRQTPVGIIGLAPYGIVPAAAPGIPWKVGRYLFNLLGNIENTNYFMRVIGIHVPLMRPDIWDGIIRRDTTNRAISSARILMGGTSPVCYDTSPLYFPVADTPGISQKLLWLIALRNIYVGLPTSITVAQAGADQQHSIQVPAANSAVEFQLEHTYIHLLPSIVTLIYNSIPKSRPPNARNPFYTYYCRTTPSIAFEFLDIYGVIQILTIDQSDWFHGESIDTLGWCIGAIQPLPVGANRQVFGLQFMRSWYTSLGVDDRTGEGAVIKLARSVRL